MRITYDDNSWVIENKADYLQEEYEDLLEESIYIYNYDGKKIVIYPDEIRIYND